jgi:fumarate reductase flavoprotein subunit
MNDGSSDKTKSAGLSKRHFLKGLSATGLTTVGLGLSGPSFAAGKTQKPYDVIVVGAGTAGLPTAIFAAQRNARVLLIDAAPAIGGTLFLSSAQMSAAGTKLQKSKGIVDTPQSHYDDVMRLGDGKADPGILRLFVDNAAPAMDWLFDHGYVALPEHPVVGGGHEPYSVPRYFWAKDDGKSIIDIFDKQLQPEIDRGKVTLLLGTKVTDLIQRKPGAPVTGVVAAGQDGKPAEYLGHQIVLTAGGYCANSETFEKFEGVKRYSDMVYPFSQGAGIYLGLKAGGVMRGNDCRQPLFNAIMVDQEVPSQMLVRITTDPARRKPWEIFVNVHGERFLQEDTPSFDEKEKALALQPEERCWVIFDDAILNAAPSLARGWTLEKTKEAFSKYPTFFKADTLAGLAKAAGIDEAGLAATVADYNRAQSQGKDKFNRQHMPLPIVKGPFYAVQMQGYYLLDSNGLKVDTSLRVLGKDGKPIPNLYAAGEMLGYGQLQGAGYSGGMSVTPAITFGRLLGKNILNVKV